ncbi:MULTISPECIES: hypothetical protein [Chitinophagaceae]
MSAILCRWHFCFPLHGNKMQKPDPKSPSRNLFFDLAKAHFSRLDSTKNISPIPFFPFSRPCSSNIPATFNMLIFPYRLPAFSKYPTFAPVAGATTFYPNKESLELVTTHHPVS